VVATSLLVLVMAGCSSGEEDEAVTPDSVVVDTVHAVPPSCTADRVQETVELFLDALSTGDASGADAMVVGEPRFQWFSVSPERLDAEASNRDSLSTFFATQVADSYQAEVQSFGFNFYRSEDRTGNFEFRLAQRSDSVGTSAVSGKGAIDCDSGLVMVWTVGPRAAA
jgi:hypothetical protein